MQYYWGGVAIAKLLLGLALGLVFFVSGCKQKQMNGASQTNAFQQDGSVVEEIKITLRGEAELEIKKPQMFKVKKSSAWKEIKKTAISKITLKENQEIKEWHINDAQGKCLNDEHKFEEDATIFAVMIRGNGKLQR